MNRAELKRAIAEWDQVIDDARAMMAHFDAIEASPQHDPNFRQLLKFHEDAVLERRKCVDALGEMHTASNDPSSSNGERH
ncbi:hypothetical protein BWR19_07500 [Halomonas sp. 1513]|nr:hypothetical protein [Halomonas sp. 1513]APX92787.1 hypothetical protein BWR19_07500 [Halomonas sp. 1513]